MARYFLFIRFTFHRCNVTRILIVAAQILLKHPKFAHSDVTKMIRYYSPNANTHIAMTTENKQCRRPPALSINERLEKYRKNNTNIPDNVASNRWTENLFAVLLRCWRSHNFDMTLCSSRPQHFSN